MRELLEKLKALLSDIHAGRLLTNDPDDENSYWFGGFSEFTNDIESVNIEWPNLAISSNEVRAALAKFESTPESEIRMGLGSSFIGQVMSIQSLMKEDREADMLAVLKKVKAQGTRLDLETRDSVNAIIMRMDIEEENK